VLGEKGARGSPFSAASIPRPGARQLRRHRTQGGGGRFAFIVSCFFSLVFGSPLRPSSSFSVGGRRLSPTRCRVLRGGTPATLFPLMDDMPHPSGALIPPPSDRVARVHLPRRVSSTSTMRFILPRPRPAPITPSSFGGRVGPSPSTPAEFRLAPGRLGPTGWLLHRLCNPSPPKKKNRTAFRHPPSRMAAKEAPPARAAPTHAPSRTRCRCGCRGGGHLPTEGGPLPAARRPPCPMKAFL